MTNNRNPLMRNNNAPQTTNYYNPQFNTILNNPEAQRIISTIQRQSPNTHPRDIAFQMAKQQGVDISQLMRRFNLR